MEQISPKLAEDSPIFLIKVSRWFLLALIFFLPLWFLPITTFQVELNKVYLVSVFALLSLVAWIGAGLQEGRVVASLNYVIGAFGVLLVSMLVSSLFSESVYASLFGLGTEPTTVVTLFLGGIIMFLIPSLFRDQFDVVRALVLLFLASFLIIVFFILQSVLNLGLYGERFFNPIGSWNDLGVFFGFVAMLAFPFLGISTQYPRVWKSAVAALLVTSLGGALIINFSWVWVGIGVIALIFLALLFSLKRSKSLLFTIAFFLIFISFLFILVRGPLASLPQMFGAPPEASPSWTSTWSVAGDVLSRNFMFGFGPNTFDLAWEQFRPVGISFTPFWRTKFDMGISTFATFLIEGGIFGFLFLLAFVGVFLWHSIKAVAGIVDRQDRLGNALVFPLISGAFFLFFMWFVYAMNAALFLLSFVLAGLLLALTQGKSTSPLGGLFYFDFFASAQKGFVISLLMILLLLGTTAGLYFTSARYVAHILHERGIEIFNTDGSVNTAINMINRAVTFHDKQDIYFRDLSRLELVKMQRVVTTEDIRREEAALLFTTALQNAITYGQRALAIDPLDAENFLALGKIYEAAAPFIAGAADRALENYQAARQLSPRDPSIVADIARVHLVVADTLILQGGGSASRISASEERRKALLLLEEALVIKPDYALAHFRLAQLYAAEGEADAAIEKAEIAFQLAPQDVGVAFQLGLLYYQQDNLVSARRAFERAIELNANYSNALYFLGLVESREGNKGEAIKRFESVSRLNPGNSEVRQILSNLKSGKDALRGIVPPAVSPEERDAPPVE